MTIGKYRTVRVSGELDMYTLPDMIARLRLLVLGGERNIAIDLSDCPYCDSESFKVFAWIAYALDGVGTVAVCGASETMIKAMKILKLDTLITLLSSTEHLEPHIYEMDMVSDLQSPYVTDVCLEDAGELSNET